MSNLSLVSVIVPVYQNAGSLPVLFEKFKLLNNRGKKFQFEFVFVDDGSSDTSYEMLRREKSKQSDLNIKIVKLTRNFGQLPALYSGLSHSTGDYLCFVSADLQDDPMLILEMAQNVDQNHQIVVAERRKRSEKGPSSWTSKLFYIYLRRFIIKNYPRNGFDYCLFTREVSKKLLSFESKNSHIFVVLLWLGYQFKTIYYDRVPRHSGRSQWTFFKRLTLFLDVAIGFSYFPIRVISSLGFLCAIFSFIYATFVVYMRIFKGNPIEGWTSIIVLNSFLGGLTLMTLGVLGEYVWRALDSSRRRPVYIEEEVLL